jgi:hypothetical protein
MASLACLKQIIKTVAPAPVWQFLRRVNFGISLIFYKVLQKFPSLLFFLPQSLWKFSLEKIFNYYFTLNKLKEMKKIGPLLEQKFEVHIKFFATVFNQENSSDEAILKAGEELCSFFEKKASGIIELPLILPKIKKPKKEVLSLAGWFLSEPCALSILERFFQFYNQKSFTHTIFSPNRVSKTTQNFFYQHNIKIIEGTVSDDNPIECDIVLDWDGFAGPHYLKFLEERHPLVVSFANDLLPSKRNDFIISFESTALLSHLKNELEIKRKILTISDKSILGLLGKPLGLSHTDLPLKKNGFITFGSFSYPFKLTELTLRIWGEVLRSIPNSQIEICNPCYVMPQYRKHLLKKFDKQGINRDRIRFSTVSGYPAYCHQFPKYDIILGSCPYPGGRTSSHMAENGFFQLSWVKHDFVNSRLSQSLFLALEVPELILNTPKEYVQMAQKLAENPEQIIEIRSKIKKSMDDYRTNHAGEMTRLVEEVLLKADHKRGEEAIKKILGQRDS